MERRAEVGNWIMDLKSGRVRWSDQMHYLMGTDPASFRPDIDSYLSLVHPEDRAVESAAVRRFLRDPRQSLQSEHRILRADGSVAHVLVHAAADLDSAGEPVAAFGSTVDLTRRRLLEQELTETMLLVDQAQRIGGVGTWAVDLPAGPGARAARSAELSRIFGVDPSSTDNLELLHVLHEEDRDVVTAAIQRAMTEGEPYDLRVRRVDGQHWLRVRGYVERDAAGALSKLWGAVQDVTEDVLSHKRLAEAQEIFRQVTSASIRQAIIATDLQGHITLFNHGAERMLGWSAQEAMGQHWSIYMDPEEALAGGPHLRPERTPPTELAEQRKLDLVQDREWGWTRRDGSRLPVRVSSTTLRDEDGELTGYVGIAVDVTDQRRAEEISRKAVSAMATARDQALQASAAKSAFLATMSHEIRTPMNAVLGLSGLLSDTELDEQQRDLLTTLRSSGDHLLRVINDVLDFSKVEAGELDLENRPFDVAALVGDVTREARMTMIREGALRLVDDIGPDVPRLLTGDVVRLRQILSNLVANAIKFTSRGEVRVFVARDGDTGLRFDVSDTGIGIPDHAKDRLFQPFSQVDASTTRVYGGSGLGLAICRGLVTAMGGRLWVQSAVGVGSTFSFSVPLTLAESAGAGPEAPGTGQTGPQQKHLRVLVAEDNPVNQKVTRLILARLGHSVELAENGQMAVDVIQAQDFDVVLMDMHMPVMDGLEATRRIRLSLPAQRQPHIVAVTASVTQADRDACVAAGMDDYLPKPLKVEDLATALERARLTRDCPDV